MPIKIVESPQYQVYGPFVVPTQQAARGKILAVNGDFWKSIGYGEFHGCYVFGMRAGQGITPWYVGKAAKLSFSDEVFNASNVSKYYESMQETRKGNPVIFLITDRNKRKNANKEHIDRLEDFLIKECAQKNPRIKNKRKIKINKIRISGVVHSGRGKASKSAESFKQALWGT